MDIKIFERRAFATVTGINMDANGLWKAGERIWNLRRAVRVKREDRTRAKDTYADGFFNGTWLDLQHGGFMLTAHVDRERFETLKNRFYTLRGCDVETGWPTRAKLEALDLKDVADELEKLGQLP